MPLLSIIFFILFIGSLILAPFTGVTLLTAVLFGILFYLTSMRN